MAVIKRSSQNTRKDLIDALDKFILLLTDQKEDDAVRDLNIACDQLKALPAKDFQQPQSEAVALIIEAFEGEHELISYTYQRDTNEWTEVEELSQVSARVLSLARRLKMTRQNLSS